jgi:murein DD-endopeptidase MepM/ murein hydrolase activator NlpD
MKSPLDYREYPGYANSTNFLIRSEMEELEALDQELEDLERAGESITSYKQPAPAGLNRSGNTFSILATGASGPFKNWIWPLPVWNGRKPVISSGFNPAPDPNFGKKHGGVDIMYRRLPNEPSKLPEGTKGYFVPSNLIPVFAVGDGVVANSGKIQTGYYVIINHKNGSSTFYLHLTANGLPAKSTTVTAGTPIGFVGHNPAGYKLNHLHFELWPGGSHARSIDPAPILRGAAGSSNVSVTALGKPAPASGPLMDAIRRGMYTTTIQKAIKQGIRDENRLTSIVFNARHPELGGRRIKKEEQQLAKEWLEIRDRLVRPSLSSSFTKPTSRGMSGAGAASTAISKPAIKVNDSTGREALAIAARKVQGLGINLEELLRRHKSESGGIPMEVLLAFIRLEAGGKLFDDKTAGKWSEKYQKYSSSFYELGVFQTPAGEHGCTSGPGNKRCKYEAPGYNVQGSTFGKGWYRFTKTYPTAANWKDPVMQVRIGLWDLTSTGERIAREFPDLFPNKGSDWYLRMAVLYSFSKGAGWTRAFLNKYRNELRRTAESQRWDFLRGKPAYFKGRNGSWTKIFDPENVDKKMALAAKIRAVRASIN